MEKVHSRPLPRRKEYTTVQIKDQCRNHNKALQLQDQCNKKHKATLKKKFESSKRKLKERLANQREAKRQIVVVDFDQMPKPANDPRAP
ncbi:hypothetical protein KY290_021202 [Solanum tuberosum]|uniref:Uncharacterized protein n=1 Tax=Solanum tuberosum TaxID=4113 RepID=A0ABQ7V0U9_SOLTU|nr:hypothetical protein KY289_020371 [Solanum tuberosum]KAH0757709.1 hypothetical protein KY290_021202 [Solanum tuberosum]